jgi:hypothetical protein
MSGPGPGLVPEPAMRGTPGFPDKILNPGRMIC